MCSRVWCDLDVDVSTAPRKTAVKGRNLWLLVWLTVKTLIFPIKLRENSHERRERSSSFARLTAILAASLGYVVLSA